MVAFKICLDVCALPEAILLVLQWLGNQISVSWFFGKKRRKAQLNESMSLSAKMSLNDKISVQKELKLRIDRLKIRLLFT